MTLSSPAASSSSAEDLHPEEEENGGHLDPNMKCIIYLNTTFGVPVTTNITLELSGDTILHYHLERALHHGFYPEVDRSHFEFIRVNQFPTRLVQLRCDDFTLAEWSC